MKIQRLLPSMSARAAAALVLLVLAVGSCDEREPPTAPEEEEAMPEEMPEAAASATLGNGPVLGMTCEVTVSSREMSCAPPEGSGPETVSAGPAEVVVGSQGTFVNLRAWDVNYDAQAQVFQMDVTVQNLLGQILGSNDGANVTNGGIRVGFTSGPTRTGGSGSVSVTNHDGTGTFTGSNQKFFQYSEYLRDDETSSRRTWRLAVDNTVDSFTFEVFVSGDVQFPDGWVEVTPDATGIAADGSPTTLTAQAKDAVGRDLSGRTYSWASSNGNVNVSPTSGSSVDVTSTTAGETSTITVSTTEAEADGTAAVTVGGSDMAVTNLRVGPDPVGVGGTLEWDVTIENHGPTAVTDAMVEVKITGGHVDHDDLVSSSGGADCSAGAGGSITTDNATHLTYVCNLGDLSAGETNDLLTRVDPRDAATFTIDASISGFSGGTDSNADNDELTRSVTSTSGPNLEAGALTITPSSTTTSDNTIQIDGSITNSGDQDAGAFTWRLMVDGTEVATGSPGVLASGGSIGSGTVTASGLGPYSAGGHKVQLVVDTDDQVDEVSEDDNVSKGGLVAEGANFDIQVVYLSDFPGSEQTIIQNAVNRWSAIITGDLTANTSVLESVNCSHPAVYGVDDLTLFVQEEEIDDPGGTLARAGPCWRRSGTLLPLTGTVTIDTDDWDSMIADNTAEFVMTHEIGHVLGIGVNWSGLGLLTGAGGSDPYFTGAAADTEFDAADGEVCYRSGETAVPVANTGGSGTRDSHWREDIMDTELMTGYSEAGGTTQELSRITVGSLADIGYTVDISSGEVDAYTVPCSGSAVFGPAQRQGVPFDEVIQARMEITEDGEVIELPRP